MVLSTTTRTSRIQSITSANQGGGDKKAGLPYQVGQQYMSKINRQDANAYFSSTVWQTRNGPPANISRPIGSTYTPNTYFGMNFSR